MHYRTFFTALVFCFLSFTINGAESTPQAGTSNAIISSESPCTRCSIQSALSKTIDFFLLFGTASGLMAAIVSRCMHDYQTNKNTQDSFAGGLVLSTLCAAAYAIKKKCI